MPTYGLLINFLYSYNSNFTCLFLLHVKVLRPSIHDVHTEGGRAQVDGGGGQAPCGRPYRKLKLEYTDIILSSSHAKKLVSFYQNSVFGWNKSGNFSTI